MSYCVYIGKNHSADNHGWLAGYGDEPSSHWLEVIPRQSHSKDVSMDVGVTSLADLPGVRSAIPQAATTFRQIRVCYSHYKGIPAPLTNGGLNEHGVAVRSVWSPSRPELVALTPNPQQGPTYSDLAGIVLDRARTAREGVETIAAIMHAHGESTYGGNTHIIADDTEAWIMIQAAGGQGLWAAERLGSDAIRACRPGYIGIIPVTDGEHPDFLYAPNLVSFAKEQGWYESGPFDFNAVYGDGLGRWDGVTWIEAELRKRADAGSKISFEDVVWAVRTEKLTGDTAGYGQVVPLVNPGSIALRLLWHAPSGAVSAPFSPVFIGQSEVPAEFAKHRYLTVGEAKRFLDANKPVCEGPDSRSTVSQSTEAFVSAVAECKRLLYLMLQAPERYLPQVTVALTRRERSLASRTQQMLKTAKVLLDGGHDAECEHLLTYFSTTELRDGLRLVQALNTLFELQVRHTGSVIGRDDPQSFDQIW